MWRRLCWGFVVLCVCSTLVAAAPSHVHFQTADEDVSSIAFFLSDAKQAAEACLSHSLGVNGSIVSAGEMGFVYSSDDLLASKTAAAALQSHLSYSSDALLDLEENVSSFTYFREVLQPLRALGWNISRFVLHHDAVVQNFSAAVDAVNADGNQSQVLVSLVSVRSLLVSCEDDLAGVRMHVGLVDDFFSTEALLGFVDGLSALLIRYEGFAEELISSVQSVEPGLFLSVERHHVYLGETMQVSGYFFAQGSFVSNQSVEILIDNASSVTVETDDEGRYVADLLTSVNQNPGVYQIQSSTIFANTRYQSDPVEVVVETIPTKLVLEADRIHCYINETVVFFGRLTDWKDRGIAASFSLHVFDRLLSLTTDAKGRFSYAYTDERSFGRYEAYASFSPLSVYQPCRSESLTVIVDTPTTLSLSVDGTEYQVGEEIIISGSLLSGINSTAVSNKTVGILLNYKQIGTAQTNDEGFYQYVLNTDDQNEGLHRLSARFQSSDTLWRSSTSSPRSVVLMVSFFDVVSEYSPLLIAAGVLGVVFAVLIVFRRRFQMFFTKKRPFSSQTEGVDSDPSQGVVARKTLSAQELYETTTRGQQPSDNNQKIIMRYQSLINALSSVGMLFRPQHTHQDVHRIMTQQGIPADLSTIIRDLFEHARYAPQTVSARDLSVFDQSVQRILQSMKGGKTT